MRGANEHAVRATRTIAGALLFTVLGAVLFLAARAAAFALPVQDFAQYWAAAHLIPKNPYSFRQVTEFERSCQNLVVASPMVMRNPPWALVFVLPFRFLTYQTAFALWTIFSIVAVTGCARAAWRLYTPELSSAPALLSLLFGPTVALLMLGQFAILVLLGVTLFLTMVDRNRDWVAGAALLFILVKPHVVLLFLLAIGLWTFQSKRWKVLVSAGLTVAIASAIVVAINPHIFEQYVLLAKQFSSELTPYPNLGGELYVLSGHHSLAYLPQICGILWLLWYWLCHRSTWNWKTHGMLALVVSVACSYYSFAFDEIVILPALMAAFSNGSRGVFLMGFVATDLGYAVYVSGIARDLIRGPQFLFWTASAWLLTYCLSRGLNSSSRATVVS
jgi:Glycosyltransferase family 87